MSPKEQRRWLLEHGWRSASVFGDLWIDPKTGGVLSLKQAVELETTYTAVRKRACDDLTAEAERLGLYDSVPSRGEVK